MKITENYIQKIIKEELKNIISEQRAGIDARAAAAQSELDQAGKAEEEEQVRRVRYFLKKYPPKEFLPKIMAKTKANKEQAKEIYKILAYGENSLKGAVQSVMGSQQTKGQQSSRDKISSRADAAEGQMERSQEVLKIISPRTPAATIRMTGSGQNMQLNGVKVPPKYIPYILKGGELPK